MKSYSSAFVRAELKRYAPNAYLENVDGKYHILLESALPRLHFKWKSYAWGRGLVNWIRNKGDCDKWAWRHRGWIIDRNLANKKSQYAIACGYIHYTTDKGGRHAINIYLVEEKDGKVEVVAFEPQKNGGPIHLTQRERESITLIVI